jgi:hypothetical protein
MLSCPLLFTRSDYRTAPVIPSYYTGYSLLETLYLFRGEFLEVDYFGGEFLDMNLFGGEFLEANLFGGEFLEVNYFGGEFKNLEVNFLRRIILEVNLIMSILYLGEVIYVVEVWGARSFSCYETELDIYSVCVRALVY